MAQKVQVLLVCDLHDEDDGNEVAGEETIAFGLDGSSYEIDLCAEHSGQMREALADYVAHARRAGRSGSSGGAPARRTPSRGSAPTSDDKQRVTEIREWAREHGHTVSDRGRLSSAVIAAYEEAH